MKIIYGIVYWNSIINTYTLKYAIEAEKKTDRQPDGRTDNINHPILYRNYDTNIIPFYKENTIYGKSYS